MRLDLTQLFESLFELPKAWDILGLALSVDKVA